MTSSETTFIPTIFCEYTFAVKVLLSRLLYTTEGSMVISSRKFENFEMFCPLGAMKLGVQQKK